MNHPPTCRELLQLSPVIPVAVIADVDDAVPMAEALARGGVPVIEVTLRTPDAARCIERIAREVPDIVVGAGTVTRPDQAVEAHQRGAQFLVTPGTTPTLLQTAAETALPVLPGASTASESLALLEQGFTAQKFFPAAASGGVEFLKALAAPLPDVEFCPTGGISERTADEYLALPNVPCVGGSWLTPSSVAARRDWAHVEQTATAAAALGRS